MHDKDAPVGVQGPADSEWRRGRRSEGVRSINLFANGIVGEFGRIGRPALHRMRLNVGGGAAGVP